MEALLCEGGADGGAQIVESLLVGRCASQLKLYIVEGDPGNGIRICSVEQDAVFAGTENIAETDIPYSAYLCVSFAGQNGDGDRLGLSPEHLSAEQSGVDGNIMEYHILDGTLIPQLQRDAPVAAADHTVFHKNISEQGLALAAEFDCGAG